MTSVNRDFKGIWIPKEIWLDNDLGWSEKLLLVEICSLDCENGCFASNEYFANFFNLSKGRISKIISELVKKGYLISTISYKKGSKQIDKRVLRATIGYSYKQRGGIVENNEGGIVENNEDNNTDISNNTINNNNIYIDTKPKKVKFTIPTISEIENYIKENNYDVDATKFFNFYESKDWFVGKNKMANWKAAVRTWVTNNQNNSKGLANGNNKANNSGVQIRSTSDIKRTITTEQIEDGIRNLYENGF